MQRITVELGQGDGKPSWSSHNWPQIFQDESGNWYGVRADWKMNIHHAWKGDEVSLLASDGKFLCRGTVVSDWRKSLEQRPGR